MSQLFSDGEAFELLSVDALYESEVRRIFLQKAAMMLPEYHVSPFDALVESPFGSGKPDLALVAKNYSDWWVVELELAHHSFDGHVVPQVRKFALGSYGEEHADYILRKGPKLDQTKLKHLVRGVQPKILVLVNSPCPDWCDPLRVLNASVAVFEIYRSGKNKTIFRLEGDLPTAPSPILQSTCELAELVPRLVVVHNPLVLGGEHASIKIMVNGRATYWSVVQTKDHTYLSPRHKNPLRARVRYVLERRTHGGLHMRPG